MNHSWSIKRLGDICTSELGKTRDEKRNKGSFRPYLCAVNVQWDKFELSELKEMRFEDNEYDRYTIRKGDLVICEGGDIGRAAIWDKDEPIHYQNALHRVRFNEGVDSRFILYYLYFLKQTGILDGRYGKGVTIKHLVKSSLLSIPVPVPPIDEQQRIVFELDLLTDIIDKKNAQLRDLNALAQSTFYEMFGDPNTNERGWKYKTLGNACALKAGKGIKASELSEEKAAGLYPCFGGNGIRGYIAKKSHKGTYPIIGRQGALCGNVQLATGEFYATEHAVVCTPGEGLHAVFVYYALLAMSLNQYATGVAQPGLAVKTLLPIPIVTPPMELQERFAEKICNIESQIDLLNVSLEQIDTLFHSRMDYYFND